LHRTTHGWKYFDPHPAYSAYCGSGGNEPQSLMVQAIVSFVFDAQKPWVTAIEPLEMHLNVPPPL
jgi:hypothetical protein